MSASRSPYADWRRENCRMAALLRHGHPDDDPDVVEARRRFVTGCWIGQFERVIAKAPPGLDAEQRAYAVSLLSKAGA